MKNGGLYQQKRREAKPMSQCIKNEAETEIQGAKSLTPYELVAVWIVTSGFALIGVVVSLFERTRHAQAPKILNEMGSHSSDISSSSSVSA